MTAIPTEDLVRSMELDDALRREGKAVWAREGRLITQVAEGSPAGKAGIQLNDIITHIDGEIVRDGRLTMHRIAMLRPGDRIGVTVQRNQQSIDLKAVVGSLRQSRVQI